MLTSHVVAAIESVPQALTILTPPCRLRSGRLLNRRLREILRLISTLPLDVAADTGALIRVDCFVTENSVDGRAQVLAGDGNSALRTTVIKIQQIFMVVT